MKKLFLHFSLLLPLGLIAQLTNSDMETWNTESNTWGYPPVIPTETFNYNDLDLWTSSNHLVVHSSLGGTANVTQEDTNVYAGSHAAKLETIYRTVTTPFGPLPFMIPGFIANGNFTIDIAGAATGAPVDPLLIPGAGTPVSTRYQRLQGYYDYRPMGGSGADTAYFLVYMLDAERAVIGQGGFLTSDSTSGYQLFDIPIFYFGCSLPDTCLIYMSSSPLSSTFSSGVEGSVLFIDELTLVTGSVNIIPQAYEDSTYTVKDNAVIIDVQANDNDCEGGPLTTAAIFTPAANGTAMLNFDQTVTYTPDAGWFGEDSFEYTLCDTGLMCANAWVKVTVLDNTGIIGCGPQCAPVAVTFTAAQLNVQTGITAFTAEIFDTNGRLLSAAKNKKQLSLQTLPAGIYTLRISDTNGTLLYSQRFAH